MSLVRGAGLAICIALCAAQVQGASEPAAPVVSDVLAAQVMLDRAGFSPGEIDGRRGRNLARALASFQRTHALQPTGEIDQATWAALSKRSGGQPPLATYEVTAEDVAGPFVEAIPRDLMKQAELDTLGYTSPLEMLAEKFHVSPSLLRELNPEATFDRAGERIVVPNVAAIDPLAPLPGSRPVARIVVSRATSALTVHDAAGSVLFHAPVTTGSARDPLPIGTWKVTGVQPLPPFHYNPALFWDSDPSHAKARIAPGPNNPVGTVWIDLTKEHYGIHGTPEPSRIGHVESHGCVRLTNWDANRVALWARPGTEVIFQ
ncbi:MAG: L,D-transpeptidase family protein [Vicinamibacterales bacterium]